MSAHPVVSARTVGKLGGVVRGPIVDWDHPDYDQARRVYGVSLIARRIRLAGSLAHG
jgi:hypothetical protein